MEPVSLLFGVFRADGKIRLSTRSSLAKYLEVTREAFTPFYDLEIASPLMPELRAIKVYFALVRQGYSHIGLK